MNRILELLKKQKVIIGALHFSPSPGFDGFDEVELAVSRAQKDLKTFTDGGVDAIIVENNYDVPHSIFVGPETSAFMTHVIDQLPRDDRPVGVSVLWNDFRTAFAIAKITDAEFIRIPAFVDAVKTSYGVAEAVAKDALLYKTKIKADKIAIFADVHVKHAEMVDTDKTLEESLIEAEKSGADAVIITGQWTGNAPLLDDLKLAKETIDLPIIVGSGADKDNIKDLLTYADGVIVSTSLKSGGLLDKKKNPNLKNFEERVDLKKVTEFMQEVRSYEP